MSRRSHNTQMFALPQGPPARVTAAGATYTLSRVFKHDFYAATCLYESPAADVPKIVVKFGRQRDFCGLPLAWLGEWFRRHEESIYRALAGVPGVPRWIGRVECGGYAMEFIDGRPLDHDPPPPKGFFDDLRKLFDAVHARGVAYCDSNKRSNILIGPGGRPWLIDYQLAFLAPQAWPRQGRPIVRAAFEYMCGKDIYHLYKHKRRMAPDELTAEEEAISRQRGGWHKLHRSFTKSYRAARRGFLRQQHESGRLVSPTAGLEDHYQPEKESWRRAAARE